MLFRISFYIYSIKSWISDTKQEPLVIQNHHSTFHFCFKFIVFIMLLSPTCLKELLKSNPYDKNKFMWFIHFTTFCVHEFPYLSLDNNWPIFFFTLCSVKDSIRFMMHVMLQVFVKIFVKKLWVLLLQPCFFHYYNELIKFL